MLVLLQTHVLVVVLFVLLYTVKVLLLLGNKQKALQKVRKHTRPLDVIFGALILVTGIWLVLNWNGDFPGYLLIKIGLVLAAIPLGIIGLKRNNKILALLGLALFAYIYGIAEIDSTTLQQTSPEQTKPEIPQAETGEHLNLAAGNTQQKIVNAIGESSLTNAKSIYVQVCANCHGEDGNKAIAGAASLSNSSLSQQERKLIIENGRGIMPAYGGQLTEQETKALAAYTLTLKTN